MKFKAAFLASSMAAAMAAPAAAQWVHSEDQSSFGAGNLNIAVTGGTDYGLGFRCTTAADAVIIFITPEKTDDETINLVNALSPELLIRVDENLPIELAGSVEDRDGVMAINATADAKLLSELKDGNKSVAVAIRSTGSIFHERDFGLVNSTDAIGKFMKGCGIPE